MDLQYMSRGQLASFYPFSTMRRLVLLSLLFACALPATARPAPWYEWISRLDGKTVCAQTSPGYGWRQGRGPFPDARCIDPKAGPR